MRIQKDEAARLLGPHHAAIRDSIYAAQEVMRDSISPLIPTAYQVVKRATMFGLIVEEVRKRFAGVPGVAIVDARHQRFLLRIESLLLRFKHVSPELRTANFPTQTALDFERQIEIEWIPKGERLTIGYLLDRLETEIAGIFVMSKYGSQVLWHYEIGGDASESGALILPIAPDLGGQRITAKKHDNTSKVPDSE